jgi:hypothetical protein
MSWNFVDHNLWQTLLTGSAVVAAYLVGRKQNEINTAIHRTQDTVELYASFAVIINKNEDDKVISATPFIYIQNVGTRLIYIDQYTFNGRIYLKDGQILPSTYSQALNNFYRIELPTNQDTHVSLEVSYHDLEDRKWSSMIFAEKINNYWDIKTLPRKPTISPTPSP